MPEHDSIRLVLADDHPIVLEGLLALLSADPGLQVLGLARNGRELIEMLQHRSADVCLLDLNMPDMDGFQAVEWIQKHRPLVKCLVLSTYEEEALVQRMLDLGVQGYLLKNTPRQQLLAAIREVAAGGTAYSAPAVRLLDAGCRRGPAGCRRPEITRREHEILKLLAEGSTNEHIAEYLHISWRTVETHRKNLMHKTACTNLASLLKYARACGWLLP